jgi:hypothetical protein
MKQLPTVSKSFRRKDMKKARKKSLSLALVFCMVISLFSGGVSDSTRAEAASATTEAKIVTNAKEIVDGYFYYPDLTVTLSNDTEAIHTLSVSVDSGFIQISSLSLKDQNGVEQTGEGLLYATGYGENSSFTELASTSAQYEALLFKSSAGFTAAATQEFLRTLHFSTESVKTTNGQTIKIAATTLSDEDMVLAVGDTQIPLYYFNGHFYGYVPASDFVSNWQVGWMDSYNEASSLQFKGVTGYLLTLTSRAEDRFIPSTFASSQSNNTIYAKIGWIGCTRETVENVENGTAGENLPKMTSVGADNPDANFKWRWVTGPEKNQIFGVQTYAYGTNGSLNCSNPDNGDGGFYTYDGCFSNWGEVTPM